jgi:hypothetical protein
MELLVRVSYPHIRILLHGCAPSRDLAGCVAARLRVRRSIRDLGCNAFGVVHGELSLFVRDIDNCNAAKAGDEIQIIWYAFGNA